MRRVGQYCEALARRLGLGEQVVEGILHAGSLHAVGKIGIPDKILLKKGGLTPEEWECLKSHTVIGKNIVGGSASEVIQMAEIVVFTHHENGDGSGYPQGLKGTDIPIVGRLTAIADAFDALISKRPYKPAFSIDKSFSILEEEKGRHFDPEVANAFLSIRDEIILTKEKCKDEPAQGERYRHWQPGEAEIAYAV